MITMGPPTARRRGLAAWTTALAAMAGLTFSLGGCPDDSGNPNGGDQGINADTDPDGTTGDNGDGIVGPDVPVDTGKEFIVDPEIPLTEGGFGWPCQNNQDCNSGFCVEGPDGYVCSKTCAESCPPEWDCKIVASGIGDPVNICIPRFQKLCVPCSDNLQCNGGTCVTIDGEGQCTFGCDQADGDAACPDGFTCQLDPAGVVVDQTYCFPTSGSCTCTTETAGAQRSCSATVDGIGTCTGVETCDPTQGGWVGCNAPTPAIEDCNGGDDDCDGLIDEDLTVDEPCENTVDGVGTCMGVRVCQGINGWVCQGPQPAAEACDFLDNDCDGEIDEDFKSGDAYTGYDHCGTCNNSCGLGFPNAKTTECLVFGNQPQCAITECEDGFVKANDFQCLPDAASICQPCATDANCLGTGAACVALTDGSYCSQACTGPADCPSGYSCTNVPESAQMQCVPASGSCSCDGTNLELQRTCSTTFTPPPPQPEYTCTGFEQCTVDGWGACQLPTEECDAVDNNCDGVVDEGFVNGDGVYDKVAHCGGCGISCLALGFDNATPACDISGQVPQCTYTCNAPFQDVNGLPGDGCECEPMAGDDLVGDGLDTNCDGIDGEVNNGIFVAKNGDDANPGTLEQPKLTIAAALQTAQTQNKRDVYVATGVYSENLVLVNGKGLFGGYSPNFTVRNPVTQETAILGDIPSGNEAGTITAAGVGNVGTALTIVDGFTIFGPNAANQAGANSYAIYLNDCGDKLEITNNRIIGGPGGNGAPGSGGGDGNDGVNATDGAQVEQLAGACSGGNTNDGGVGGVRVCGGTNVSGGDGGRAECSNANNGANYAPDPDAAGISGSGPSAGAGGAAGGDGYISSTSGCGTCNVSGSYPSAGQPGTSGNQGADGQAGSGCNASSGNVIGGNWIGGAGADGATGQHGSGGGGGGAGRGVNFVGCGNADQLGGSGGGGGSGGCRATGGTGGTAGGGSFGVFLTYSAATTTVPIMSNNTVRRGAGGSGGTGGPGGAGGLAGAGGNGGPPLDGVFCAVAGGVGGDGGRGGHGGGGGGGCGGASYGIYAFNASGGGITAYNGGNAFQVGGSGGAGGQGGPSLGNSGGVGANGVSADTNF